MNVEQTVWNIYTFATLHGNPRDPSTLTATGMIKLLKECRIFDANMVEKLITKPQIHIIFAQEAKNASEKLNPKALERKVVERVDYDGFLSCLIRIASACYPSSKNGDHALLCLLMDNILPLASRHDHNNISNTLLKNSKVLLLKSFFQDAINSVFQFYAANAANTAGTKNLMRTATSGGSNGPKTFSDHE